MRARRQLALLTLLIVAPTAAWGQKLPAEAEAGRALAERRCASYHRIAPGEPTPPDIRAPSFQTIADAEAATPRAICDWLHQPPGRDGPTLRFAAPATSAEHADKVRADWGPSASTGPIPSSS